MNIRTKVYADVQIGGYPDPDKIRLRGSLRQGLVGFRFLLWRMTVGAYIEW